jgi:methionyl-tRNA formyltransferase
MKIIFMGTPKFACPTLQKLIDDANFEVVAVYTREPQIAGRGHKLQNSPIHELALKSDIKVFTPKTLRNAEIQKEFLELKADAAVVVAYGLILPQEILSGTRLGCFNIHPSLLPKWRGAAPIQRTIMNGDKETAICIIKMDAGLDSGNIVAQENYSLKGNETYGELEEKFAENGAEILIKTLQNLRDGKVKEIQQNHALTTYAKKIEKAECEIDWQKSVEEIEQKIRALNGSLGAYFLYDDEKIKIFTAEILSKNSSTDEAGKILDENFSIQCGQGVIKPLILQRQGKKPMTCEELLRGFKLEIGKKL